MENVFGKGCGILVPRDEEEVEEDYDEAPAWTGLAGTRGTGARARDKTRTPVSSMVILPLPPENEGCEEKEVMEELDLEERVSAAGVAAKIR